MMPITARMVLIWSIRLGSGSVCGAMVAGETWATGLLDGDGTKAGGLGRLTAILPPEAGGAPNGPVCVAAAAEHQPRSFRGRNLEFLAKSAAAD